MCGQEKWQGEEVCATYIRTPAINIDSYCNDNFSIDRVLTHIG